MATLISREEFDASLIHGRILYFRNPGFAEKPHPHICVADKDGGIMLMTCGTSQKATIERFLRNNDLPSSSVVWINPDDSNGLTKETYLNCNEMPFEFSQTELFEMYSERELKIWGSISNVHYEQLLMGYIESELIDTELQEMLQSLLDN